MKLKHQVQVRVKSLRCTSEAEHQVQVRVKPLRCTSDDAAGQFTLILVKMLTELRSRTLNLKLGSNSDFGTILVFFCYSFGPRRKTNSEFGTLVFFVCHLYTIPSRYCWWKSLTSKNSAPTSIICQLLHTHRSRNSDSGTHVFLVCHYS